MRVVYVAESPAFWQDHYMKGYGMQIYSGLPYQRGAGIGSILRGIFRFAWPLIRRAGPVIASEGVRAIGDVASDVAQGEQWKAATKKRAKQAAGRLLVKGGTRLQKGEGVGKRSKSVSKTIKRPSAKTRKARKDIYS